MKRKDIILFMIVGTGVNSYSPDDGFMSLARKLYSTITKIHPDHVVFFMGMRFVGEKDYQIVQIDAIDDFNACFEIFETKIWEFDFIGDEDNCHIIMDYTSGTKTMSAAMACCGMFYSKGFDFCRWRQVNWRGICRN